MPRENSFSDSDGVSLTPDLSDAEDNDAPPPISPTYSGRNRVPSPVHLTAALEQTQSNAGRPSQSSARVVPVSPIRPTLHPRERFRSAVRKVMALHRSTSMMISGGVGGEPGVDPRRASADAQFGKVRADCVIELVDYSSFTHSYGRMTNKEFINLLADPKASKREPWVKVRWINIGGLSWDVMKAVSLKYDIHPLALEDVFHSRLNTRSKADYYTKHLFLRVLCHELANAEDEEEQLKQMRFGSSAVSGSTLVNDIDIPRSSSPEPLTEEDKMKMEFMEEEVTLHGTAPNSRKSTMRNRARARMARDVEKGPAKPAGLLSFIPSRQDSRRKRMQEAELKVHALKKGEKVHVRQTAFYIFLYRDGTVITMQRYPDLSITQPILQRLQQRDTGLRTSADPALLVQSLLDLIVDKAVVVVEEYETRIKNFESQILLRPSVSTVRNLHIFSEDLILLKRALEPIKTLVYGLRRYDVDRCAALIDPSKLSDQKVEGYMSHKSKIYLADVYDHMEYVLSSLDMFAAISENLINYTFNMTSYEMNEVMRRLTLVTIVLLPLTFLTGYFGMNFDPMWSVQQNSDILFWEIAIPMMAIVVPLFVWPDIKRALARSTAPDQRDANHLPSAKMRPSLAVISLLLLNAPNVLPFTPATDKMPPNDTYSFLYAGNSDLPEGTFIAAGLPKISDLADFLELSAVEVHHVLLADVNLKELEDGLGLLKLPDRESIQKNSTAGFLGTIEDRLDLAEDLMVFGYSRRNRRDIDITDQEEDILSENKKTRRRIGRAIRDLPGAIDRIFTRIAPTIETMSLLLYISRSSTFESDVYGRHEQAWVESFFWTKSDVGEWAQKHEFPRLKALTLRNAYDFRHGSDLESADYMDDRILQEDGHTASFPRRAPFPSFQNLTHLHIVHSDPHGEAPPVLDSLPSLTHARFTGGPHPKLYKDSPREIHEGWSKWMNDFLPIGWWDNILRAANKYPEPPKPESLIPPDLHIFIHPEFSPGLTSFGGFHYDGHVRSLQRIEDEEANVHLIWPNQEDWTKTWSLPDGLGVPKSSLALFPVNKAVSSFKDRVSGGDGDWTIEASSEESRMIWW
ncbi:hypothetical protein V5O48_006204 [Marasmius crinis-equi]|uniref:Uncharacterized protein n=1 Tax=Marasmius crinis-equi TaxID=585013 RepID=A0ABR3FK47_9AGAR